MAGQLMTSAAVTRLNASLLFAYSILGPLLNNGE